MTTNHFITKSGIMEEKAEDTLVELPSEVSSCSEAVEKLPARHYIDIRFLHPPVKLHCIAFTNFYTHSISIMHTAFRAQPDLLPAHQPWGRSSEWQTVLRKHTLMENPHYEDDAQAEHLITRELFTEEFDSARVVRLRFVCMQPSPTWSHYGVRNIRCFALQKSQKALIQIAPSPSLCPEDAEFSQILTRLVGGLATTAGHIRQIVNDSEPNDISSDVRNAMGPAHLSEDVPAVRMIAQALPRTNPSEVSRSITPYALGDWKGEAQNIVLL